MASGGTSYEQISAQVRALNDRVEITEILNRYVRGVSTDDHSLIASCFTEDSVFDLGYVTLRGRSEIFSFYKERFAAWSASAQGPTGMVRTTSTPMNSNIEIVLQNESAQCDSACLAVHLGKRESREVVAMRGTKNKDKFLRTAEGWRIQHRIHLTIWATEVPAQALSHTSMKT